jgi:6-phosphogluconolactonase (cycloisomerase 2 family)
VVILAGSLASAHSVFAQSGVTGHVYVNLNTSPVNTIAAFDRHVDGSLTPTPGSPFVAGGYGAAVASQGALQISADGRYLLAADAGSNQISVLSINADGSLRLVNNGPVSSGGTTPVSIAVYGNEVVVGNDGDSSGGANYTGFRLAPNGFLAPIPGASFVLPSPTTIGDVLFSPDGKHLVGTRVDTSLIDSFVVTPRGIFVPAGGSPFANPAGFYGPFGSQFRPTNAHQLFVSNAHDASGGGAPGTVSAFDVAPNGSVFSLPGSPFSAGGQIATCWVDISHDGQYLFGVNTGSGSVSSFSIKSNGSLSLIGSSPLTGAAGALDAGITPGDTFLYVVERGTNAVAGLHVNGDGSLTELPSSPTALPGGSTAFGIVVD